MRFEFPIVGVLSGIVAGLRHTVWILVPAIMLAAMLVVLVGVARADSMWSIVLTVIATVTAVQLGYLGGIVIRALMGNGDTGRNP